MDTGLRSARTAGSTTAITRTATERWSILLFVALLLIAPTVASFLVR